MVQKEVHRSLVRYSFRSIGKSNDTQRSCQMVHPLCALIEGGDRKAFPCSGYGYGTSWYSRGSNGNYWSSSLGSQTNGRNLNFNSGGVNPQNNNNRFYGFAVRPVQHSTVIILLHLIIDGTA